jgi:branched-chain amino acid transport system permease protein
LATIFPVFSGSGTAISIKSFIMIIIGGAGVVSGAIVGGFVLGMTESVGYGLIPGSMTYLLIFCAVILLLALRPQGIMGKPWG